MTIKKQRGGWHAQKVIFSGEEYPSMLALYNQEKRDIRRVSHRAPAIDYGKFVDILKKTTPEMAVWNMRQWKLHSKGKKKGYDKQSKYLGGAANLVCQRITKLGWSEERARNTPVMFKSAPKPVRYKGRVYRSITACFKASKPKCSITHFAKFLREMGCMI